MKKAILSTLTVSALFALGCGGARQADFRTDARIKGENGKEARFAIFGAAEGVEDGVDKVRMVLIASERPDLCGEIEADFNNDVNAFLVDLQEGDLPGIFIVTNVDTTGQLQVGERFKGVEEEGLVVDPQFLVSDGVGFKVQAVDKEAEGEVEILAFDGQILQATVNANLNRELSGFFNKKINNPLAGDVFEATNCGAITDFLEGTFVVEEENNDDDNN